MKKPVKFPARPQPQKIEDREAMIKNIMARYPKILAKLKEYEDQEKNTLP